MAKITMKTPLVEMDGDEMTRILWQWIKETLLEPYVELKTEYYDLGLKKREETKDQILIQRIQRVISVEINIEIVETGQKQASRAISMLILNIIRFGREPAAAPF